MNFSKLFFAITSAAIVLFPSCTIRQVQSEPRTVSVSGTGIVYAEPDYAKITLSVLTTNKDLIAASTENAEKMNAVQEALLASGLTKDDISTENYSIEQESRWENNRQIFGNYRVSNEIVATVHKIEQSGIIIDAAVKAGANRLSTINFGVSDTQTLVKQARIQAIKQAEESAKLLASTSSATLGKVISIEEHSSPYSVSYEMDNAVMATARKATAPTSINAEKTKISITVDVTYALQ